MNGAAPRPQTLVPFRMCTEILLIQYLSLIGASDIGFRRWLPLDRPVPVVASRAEWEKPRSSVACQWCEVVSTQYLVLP